MENTSNQTGIECPFCKSQMKYVGSYDFRTGGAPSLFSKLGQIFEQTQTFAIFKCFNCNHISLFDLKNTFKAPNPNK